MGGGGGGKWKTSPRHGDGENHVFLEGPEAVEGATRNALANFAGMNVAGVTIKGVTTTTVTATLAPAASFWSLTNIIIIAVVGGVGVVGAVIATTVVVVYLRNRNAKRSARSKPGNSLEQSTMMKVSLLDKDGTKRHELAEEDEQEMGTLSHR